VNCKSCGQELTKIDWNTTVDMYLCDNVKCDQFRCPQGSKWKPYPEGKE